MTGRVTLLLVEDNQDDVALMRRSLQQFAGQSLAGEAFQQHTWRLQCAATLAEAESLVSRADAVCLDLTLPDSTGPETVRRMRRRTSLPICVVSGDPHPQTIWRSMEAGADAYLLKGATAEQTFVAITCLLYRAVLAAQRQAERRRVSRQVIQTCDHILEQERPFPDG